MSMSMPTSPSSSQVGAIILAMDTPLLWADLHGQPVLARTLNVFAATALVAEIVIVVDAAHIWPLTRLAAHNAWRKLRGVRLGRSLRPALLHALHDLSPQVATVIVHDGARPLVTETLISSGLQAATLTGATSASVPLKETVKRADTQDIVIATPDRAGLRLLQTPQVFTREVLQHACEMADPPGAASDAAQVVERAGGTVTLFPGAYPNVRIATSADLALARAIWATEIR